MSSEELYLLPSQLITAINQTAGLQQAQKEQALKSILYSLEKEIKRELLENSLDKCIIDTSPFFAGERTICLYLMIFWVQGAFLPLNQSLWNC